MVSAYQSLRSQMLMNLNMRVEKDFRIKGTVAKIMLEAFNLTNRENIKEIYANVASPDFGTPWSLGEPRKLQASVRFEW